MGVRNCPVAKMTLCVTSDAEKNKCVKMRVSIKIFPLLRYNVENYIVSILLKIDEIVLYKTL